MRGGGWAALLTAVAAMAACAAAAHRSQAPLLLLLDTSGTMASQNRQFKVRAALRGWIQSQVPSGVRLSLWKYTDSGSEVKTVLLNDEASRQELAEAIPIRTRGETCTSCGLLSVMESGIQNATILIITDGEDNYLEDDFKEIIKKRDETHSQIICLLFGNSTYRNDIFHDISQGWVYRAKDENTLPILIDTFWQALHFTFQDYSLPITVFESETYTHLNSTFLVDRSLANYARACIYFYYWPDTMNLSVDLTTPNGSVVDVPVKSGYSQYCELYEGTWRLEMNSQTFNKFMAVQVAAISPKTDEAILFGCWFLESKENAMDLTPPIVQGSLNAGSHTIGALDIRAEIEGPGAQVTTLQLLKKNDSNDDENLFSRYFIPTSESGAYSARCWATGNVTNGANTQEVSESPPFVRLTRTKELKIKGSTSVFPPSRITDLEIVNVTGTSVLLQFTAPGSQFDVGKALQYKLTISTSQENHHAGRQFLLSDFPDVAGSKEVIHFSLPSDYTTSHSLYISVVAVGENNMEAPASNIDCVVLAQTQGDKIKSLNNISEEEFGNVAVYIAIGILATVIVIIVSIFIFRRVKNSYTYNVQNAEVRSFIEHGPG